MKLRQSVLQWLYVVASLFVAGYVTWFLFSPCPDFSHPTTNIKSVFVRSAWPPPDAAISFGCYTRKNLQRALTPYPLEDGTHVHIVKPNGGIAVTIDYVVLAKEMSAGRFSTRVSFMVDGEEKRFVHLDRGTLLFTWDPVEMRPSNSPYVPKYYYLGTVPFLTPGDHTAKVAVKRVNGSVVEYEWHFRITWW